MEKSANITFLRLRKESRKENTLLLMAVLLLTQLVISCSASSMWGGQCYDSTSSVSSCMDCCQKRKCKSRCLDKCKDKAKSIANDKEDWCESFHGQYGDGSHWGRCSNDLGYAKPRKCYDFEECVFDYYLDEFAEATADKAWYYCDKLPIPTPYNKRAIHLDPLLPAPVQVKYDSGYADGECDHHLEDLGMKSSGKICDAVSASYAYYRFVYCSFV